MCAWTFLRVAFQEWTIMEMSFFFNCLNQFFELNTSKKTLNSLVFLETLSLAHLLPP